MAKRDRRPPEPNYWEYELPGGFTVLAGKTDADNDRLSLRVARANDYWFHVKGMPGSHVILKVEELEPDREAIEQAAAIAAYHSKARGGGTTAVTVTQAKHVSKSRGAPAGTVQVRRERTIKVKPGLPE